MKLTIKPNKISKFLFLFYILYTNVFSYSLFFVKGLSSMLLVAALVLEVYNSRFKIKREKTFFAYVIFLVYIVTTGFLIAKDSDRLISTVLHFTEYLVVYYLIISYTIDDKKADFAINAFVLLGIVSALFLVFRGTEGVRVSIADEVNVNLVAVTMTFSIAFILYELIEHEKTALRVIVSIAAILLLIFGVLLTVSKKAIFGSSAAVILWIVCCYKTTFKKIKSIYKIVLVVSILAIVVTAYLWYTTYYASQLQYLLFRMSQITTGLSSVGRIQLFKEGLQIFLDHPFFGVGFNNVRYYTSLSTYTHCFYSEVLACSGIFGTLIFVYALGVSWKRVVSVYRPVKTINEFTSIRIVYMIIIYLVLLFVSATQIIFYEYNLMYVLAVITGFGLEMQSFLNNRAEKGSDWAHSGKESFQSEV